MSETYTREDLKAMSRVELRRLAVRVLQADNKDITNLKSDDIIDRVLEAQEGGGGKKGGKAAPKGRGMPGNKGKVKEDEGGGDEGSGDEGAQEEAPPKGKAAAAGNGGIDLKKHFDALGKAVDEGNATLKEQLDEIERKQFVMLGLVSDIYKFNGEPDELDTRLVELQEDWEKDQQGGN